MSTYSTNLGLTLIGTGEEAGTWGTTTNTNLGTLLEQSITGYVTQVVTDGAATVLTIPNGSSGVARNMYLELTGIITAARTVEVPANKKLYFVYNNTTGGYAVTFKVTGQTGISVPNGKKMALVCDGSDIVVAENYLVGTLSGTATNAAEATNAANLVTTNFTVTESGGVLAFIAHPSFTASIAGTTMTVTSANAGDVVYGATLSGTGVTGGTTVGEQITSTVAAAASPAYSSGGASGESSFGVASTAGIVPGQMVDGTGVPTGTYVLEVSGGSVFLGNRVGVAVTLTTQASGNYNFRTAGAAGTYTVSAAQTVASTTITGTKTVAQIANTGLITSQP